MTSRLSPIGRAALRYGAAGWPVFPLHSPTAGGCSCRDAECESPAKHPRITQGFKNATADARQIGAWWTRWPDANIGFAPGAAGLLVLDVDGPAGERELAALGLADVHTLECLTGRDEGGRHLYFARPAAPIGNPRADDHLDVRCDGGYVLLPPSLHPSGRRYQWRNRLADLAPTPTVLMDSLERRRAAESAPPPVRIERPDDETLDRRVRAYIARLGARGEGARNNAAYQLAAWLTHDMALRPDLAFAYLVTWNAENTPPLRSRELQQVLASASATAKRPLGCALAEAHA